ncbi:hypothetical protein Tco_1077516 [Tanacetum coccineum]
MIVGGEPTGVDLAGEIAVDYLNKKITLVHKGYGLLEFLRVKASKKTLDWLQAKHVEVKLEQTINLEDVADGSKPKNQEFGSPSLMPDYLCLPSKSYSWTNYDDLDTDDVVPTDTGSPLPEEKQHSTPANTDAASNSMNSEENSVASAGVSIVQGQSSIVPENVISPKSQEKLCQAMKSTELPDDMDLFKCKEKLYFGEPAENTFSSTKSDVSDNKPSVHSQRATPIVQNIVYISPDRSLLKKKMLYEAYRSPSVKNEADEACRLHFTGQFRASIGSSSFREFLVRAYKLYVQIAKNYVPRTRYYVMATKIGYRSLLLSSNFSIKADYDTFYNLSASIRRWFKVLLDLLSNGYNVACLLPEKLVSNLLRRRNDRCLNLTPWVVAEAFSSIEDPFVIVCLGHVSPKIHVQCAIFVDLRKSREEIKSVLFSRNTTLSIQNPSKNDDDCGMIDEATCYRMLRSNLCVDPVDGGSKRVRRLNCRVLNELTYFINERKKESLREISEFVNGQFKESPNTFTLSVKSLFKKEMEKNLPTFTTACEDGILRGGEDITDLDGAFDKLNELLQAFVASPEEGENSVIEDVVDWLKCPWPDAKKFHKRYVVHSESHDAKNTKVKGPISNGDKTKQAARSNKAETSSSRKNSRKSKTQETSQGFMNLNVNATKRDHKRCKAKEVISYQETVRTKYGLGVGSDLHFRTP